MREEAAVMFIVATAWALGFLVGVYTAHDIWRTDAIESGKAHYVVNPTTGATELVWTESEK